MEEKPDGRAPHYPPPDYQSVVSMNPSLNPFDDPLPHLFNNGNAISAMITPHSAPAPFPRWNLDGHLHSIPSPPLSTRSVSSVPPFPDCNTGFSINNSAVVGDYRPLLAPSMLSAGPPMARSSIPGYNGTSQRDFASSLLYPLINRENIPFEVASVIVEWILSFSTNPTGGLGQLIEAVQYHPDVVVKRIRLMYQHLIGFNGAWRSLNKEGAVATTSTDPFAALVNDCNPLETTTKLLTELDNMVPRIEQLSQQNVALQVALEEKEKELTALRKASASVPAPLFVPAAASSMKVKGPAHCHVCTFINDVGADKCGMCGCAIGSGSGSIMPPVPNKSPPPPPLNPLQWECSICTFINSDIKQSTCDVCGSSKSTGDPLPTKPPTLQKSPSSGKTGFDKALAESSCPICESAPQNAIYIPCGHNASCIKCAEMIKKMKPQCPICNKVSSFIQFFPV